MKFFVPEEWDDSYSSEAGRYRLHALLQAQEKRYAEHLERMRCVLPDRVLRLAQIDGFDDGLVVLVRHDRLRRILALNLRCGDSVKGYYDLTLRYTDADISASHELMLACIARTTLSRGRWAFDTMRQELDITVDGRIEHRILFHGGYWFAVRCAGLQWARIPKPNRNLPHRFDRVPGGPVTSRTTFASLFPDFDSVRGRWISTDETD